MNIRTLKWTENALAAAGDLLIAASLGDRDDVEWAGAVVDSRANCASRLFFALDGEKADGHDFIDAAIARGSVAVILEKADAATRLTDLGQPWIQVRDGRRALIELARAYRRELDVRVTAITGSGGKTTTKELIREVLRQKYRVHSTAGNFNSTIGVPVTILEMDPDSEHLVCEVGASEAGEVGMLTDLLRPAIGVITNIGDAHIGYFGSRQGVAAAKGEMLDHIADGGLAVLPADDDFMETLRSRWSGKTRLFGRGANADVRLTDIYQSGSTLAFTINEERFEMTAVGEYNAMNAAVAFAVGESCGVEFGNIREALFEFMPMAGRGRVVESNGITVIDESYNASPASMKRSLDMLVSMPGSVHVAVLGDMLELGSHAEALHKEVGRHLGSLGLTSIYWGGEFAGAVQQGLDSAGVDVAVIPCADNAETLNELRATLQAGTVILVKGSRSIGLDEVVAGLVSDITS